MDRVVIESPLSAPTREGIEANKLYAKNCMLDSLRRGEAPYASHLLFDQPGLLDDLKEDERLLGMRAGTTWYVCAELVAVYTDFGISHGMKLGIQLAQQLGIKVVYRQIKEATPATEGAREESHGR